MAVFPSLDWFQKVRDVYNSDSTLHKGGGGACHTTAAFKVDGQSYLIVFEGLKCADIRTPTDGELERGRLRDRDAVRSVEGDGRERAIAR